MTYIRYTIGLLLMAATIAAGVIFDILVLLVGGIEEIVRGAQMNPASGHDLCPVLADGPDVRTGTPRPRGESSVPVEFWTDDWHDGMRFRVDQPDGAGSTARKAKGLRMMIWVPRRLCMHDTSARDWYVLLIELGDRVVRDIHAENPYGKVYRGG